MAPPVVVLEDVGFAYRGGGAAVSGFSLSVAEGEMTGLLGPNGAGKTTLLKLVNGLLRPDAGRITILGRPLGTYGRRELARRMAVVYQSRPVFFPFTVEETVAMGRWARSEGAGWLCREDREAVRRAMERTDVAGLKDRLLDELSGGERQRALLARALAQEAGMLLLDEPVAHLDVRHQLDILDLLEDINRREGHTVLMTIHDLNLAARYCRRLVVMDKGRLAAEGTPDEVLRPELLGKVFGVSAAVDANPLTGTRRITIGTGVQANSC